MTDCKLGKKIILTALFMLSLLPLQAQQLNFYTVDAQTGKPVSDVTIWTFNLGKMAQGAKYTLENEGFFDETKYDLSAKGETGTDGFVGLKASMTGYALVEIIRGDYDYTEVVSIAKLLKGADVKIRIPRASKDRKDSVLKEVPIVSIRPIPASGDGIAERHGKMKTIYKELSIDPDLARNDARYAVAPRVVLPQYGDSIAMYLTPAIVDGTEYAKTMRRRMHYDLNHDKGNAYHQDTPMKMQSHKGERFYYVRHLYPVQPGVKYVVTADEWYEDYKVIYHQDQLLISDGNDREPMRFLNWDDAKKTMPINREQYRKKGKSEMTEYPMEFHMEFEVNKNELNLNDSLTRIERDRLIDWINSYYQDGNSQINYVTVKGYASPEGGRAHNAELSHGRANYIVQMLKARFPETMRLQNVRAEFDKNDNIVPWSVVADTLDAMGDEISKLYAERIREVCAEKSTLDAQQAELRKDPELWEYIKVKGLPQVRRVEIKSNVTTMRVLTQEEIFTKYESDPNWKQGKGMMDYQFYEVMCHLADNERWDELYTISKAAYESPVMAQNATRLIAVPWEKATKEEQEGYRRAAEENGTPLPDHILRSKEESRPDPLAAYYYASCLLRKGIVNKNVLRPFMDDGQLNRQRRTGGELVTEYNDVSIISIQVLMHCMDDDFQAANSLIQKYNLKQIPELKTLIMFVRCLNGEYKSDPEVRSFVAATSPMNDAVISAAVEEYDRALRLLKTENQNDMRVQYLKAICLFNRLPEAQRSSKIEGYSSANIWSPEEEDEDMSPAWAAPMLRAFELDSNNAKYIQNDGYFNNAYRQMTLYFWKRIQDGADMQTIAQEYDALVAEQQEKNKNNAK